MSDEPLSAEDEAAVQLIVGRIIGRANDTRNHPIDIIDEVLHPLLGSLKATETAVTIWLKLRREGLTRPLGAADSVLPSASKQKQQKLAQAHALKVAKVQAAFVEARRGRGPFGIKR